MTLAILEVTGNWSWLALMVLVLVGVGLLSFGGDALARGASASARRLQINPLVIGLTVVSVATSMPEMVTCLISAFGGAPDMTIGNIIGSNLGNIGLILGISALVLPLAVQTAVIRIEVPILFGATVLFMVLCWGGLQRWEGILMLVVTVVYVVLLFRRAGTLPEEEKKVFTAEVPEEAEADSLPISVLLVIGGGIGLWIGAEFVFQSAVEIAQRLGVSDFVIGLTVVAIGTSLPELAASLAAALRKEADLIVGNIVGSNLFNMLLIGGTVSTLVPFHVDAAFFRFELPAMLGVTVLLWWHVLTGKRVTRYEGIVLILCYLGVLGFSAWIQA